MTTLNVRWEPAEGRVKEYKVVYVPAAGGAESMVGLVGQPSASCRPRYSPRTRPSLLNQSVVLNQICPPTQMFVKEAQTGHTAPHPHVSDMFVVSCENMFMHGHDFMSCFTAALIWLTLR